jgi:hypothetical protein
MMTFLIAAVALAETTNSFSLIGPADEIEHDTIVVEGHRSAQDWQLPKLDYDEPDSCPAFVESEIPGFGVMRIRKRCAGDQTEEWRLFQY